MSCSGFARQRKDQSMPVLNHVEFNRAHDPFSGRHPPMALSINFLLLLQARNSGQDVSLWRTDRTFPHLFLMSPRCSRWLAGCFVAGVAGAGNNKLIGQLCYVLDGWLDANAGMAKTGICKLDLTDFTCSPAPFDCCRWHG
jgi:hypothetical protein